MSTSALSGARAMVPEAQKMIRNCFQSLEIKPVFQEQEKLQQLFRETIKEYGNGVTEEVKFNAIMNMADNATNDNANANDTRQQKERSSKLLQTYEDHRQTSSGVVPCLVFGSLFCSLSPSIYCDSRFRDLLRIGSLISGLDNDIQSQSKSKEGDWDYIAISIYRGGYSKEQAIQACYTRHHELISEYNRLAKELELSANNNDSSVMNEWSKLVGPSVFHGFFKWQCYAKRYKNDDQADSQQAMMDILFPGEPCLVVNEDGTFQGLDNSLRNKLNTDTLHWAKSVGLVSDQSIPEKKFHGIDPGLVTMLLYSYAANGENMEKLAAFCRFFVLVLFIDDLWERAELHDDIKQTVFECVDEFI